MRKNKKKILIYVVLTILYLAIVCIFITNNKKIEFAINTEKYVQHQCGEKDIIEMHECVLNDKNEVEILGDDPYLVVGLQPMKVGSVALEILKDYSGEYKIYYALNEGFSEDRVAIKSEEGENVFLVGEYVDLIRVDFEYSSPGMKYNSNGVKINLNDNIGQDSDGILKALYFLSGYVFLSLLYMFYLLKMNRFVGVKVICIYNVAISCVWTYCISRQIDIFTNLIIFLVACMGMFFWGNSTVLEEKKWIEK